MADTKISALTASTTPLAGTEVLPIVQSGTTKQVSVANLTAGRAISATQLTLTTGNLIVANGQGIDFSADPSPAGMTSELLDDYEEGNWTPTQGGGLVVVGSFSSSGTYTKIGRFVFVRALLVGSTSIAATAGGGVCGGFPYTVDIETGQAVNDSASGASQLVVAGAIAYSVQSISASTRIVLSATFIV